MRGIRQGPPLPPTRCGVPSLQFDDVCKAALSRPSRLALDRGAVGRINHTCEEDILTRGRPIERDPVAADLGRYGEFRTFAEGALKSPAENSDKQERITRGIFDACVRCLRPRRAEDGEVGLISALERHGGKLRNVEHERPIARRRLVVPRGGECKPCLANRASQEATAGAVSVDDPVAGFAVSLGECRRAETR